MKKLLITGIIVLIFSNLAFAQTKNIALEDIWLKYQFYPKTINGFKSMKNGETYTVIDQNNLDEYSYKSGKHIKTLIDAGQLIPEGESKPIRFSSYTFSPDETKILLVTNKKSIYRHSFTAEYWIYDFVTKKLQRLSENGAQRLASFSPDGQLVAFMRDNNLFIKNLQTNTELQFTNDGAINKIINGAPDWVYEEEFSFNKAYEWSPDSRSIAYIRFDESNVKEFEFTIYGDLYPKQYKYKYPKAGEDNSIVSVHVYDLATAKTKTMDIGSETDIYIPRIKWTTDPNVLSIQRLNRLQNKWEILLANASDGTSKVLYSEENKYYIDITDNLIFLKKNKGFIFTSEMDGYNHIYYYDMQGKLIKQLTKGKYDVSALFGLDEKKGVLYYQAGVSSPINREIFSVNINNLKRLQLSKHEGTNSAQFSSNFKYYINTFSDANTPPIFTVNKSNGTQLYVLENNINMVNKLKDYGYSNKTFFTIKTDNDIELNAWMIKPLDFDSTKRYPVLMYLYGGPGSQTVTNSWGWFNLMWFEMLAQKGYIVVSVDNRGTGARGEEFKKCTYLQLGKLETIDQINANKYLATLPYVDRNRIGIFGWSYGGYMSTLCMTKGASYFKTGIAVAPVTNWRYYDNIYTERFMRTPQENGDGYDSNSPISHTAELKGNYLLIHGTADDNVHLQNSMDLITSLLNNNKQFEMQFYPNSDHSIYTGRYTHYHVYRRMTDFLLEKL
ncbi:MAG: S9 family peptidase [Bacteroidetes bacterium]|nr:MAG: S9 family peptidase [Bacteroidota bacterium]